MHPVLDSCRGHIDENVAEKERALVPCLCWCGSGRGFLTFPLLIQRGSEAHNRTGGQRSSDGIQANGRAAQEGDDAARRGKRTELLVCGKVGTCTVIPGADLQRPVDSCRQVVVLLDDAWSSRLCTSVPVRDRCYHT